MMGLPSSHTFTLWTWQVVSESSVLVTQEHGSGEYAEQPSGGVAAELGAMTGLHHSSIAHLQLECQLCNTSALHCSCMRNLNMLHCLQRIIPAATQCEAPITGCRSIMHVVCLCRESVAINSSLMTLARCLEVLRYNQQHPADQKIIPYRESKVTCLLMACAERFWPAATMPATVLPCPTSIHMCSECLNRPTATML